MKILVTGRGTSGSWQIRGVQLGRAIGATVQPMAMDVAGYDLAIVVKRTPADLIGRLHAARVPIVYDVVDGWPQPEGNTWERGLCQAWLHGQIKHVKPAGIVTATRAMADDCLVYGIPTLALPHHSRPGLQRARLISEIKVLGYEGSPAYIQAWKHHIEYECGKRGLKFLVNPPDLSTVDVVLALRDATGYAPYYWKSNVKLANAQAAGLPIICARERGYLETASGVEFWADFPQELATALDALQATTRRHDIADAMFKSAPMLASVATDYLEWLRDAVLNRSTLCDAAGR